MGRAVTKNNVGELEIDETFSFSGSNPTLDSVKLIAEDGKAVDKENPSWLGFTQTTSGSDLTATLQLDASGLSTYTTYTFEISATDDAGNQKTRRVNVGIGSLTTTFFVDVVAGQEDKYRQQNGQRIDRGGNARIIAYTSMDATLDIDYVRNPSDEDNPSFDQSLTAVSQGRRHEFFFSVVLSSLYAFKLTARADYDNSVPDLESGIYYFQTGSTAVATASGNPTVATTTTINPAKQDISQELSSQNFLGEETSITVSKKAVTTTDLPKTSLSFRSVDVQVGPPDFFEAETTTLISSQQV